MKAFILALLLMSAIAFANAAPGDIRILEVKGTPAEVVHPVGTVRPARKGAFLRQGETIKTPPRSSVVLLFSNGALLALEPDSELLIGEFECETPARPGEDPLSLREEPSRSRTALRLGKGLLFIDSLPLHRGSIFQASTPLGGAGIRGTAFFLMAASHRCAVGVSSGSVAATDNSGKTLLLAAGRAASLSPIGFAPASATDIALIAKVPATFQGLRRSARSQLPQSPARPAPTAVPKSRASFHTTD